MFKLTEKENLLRVFKGEEPEYLPYYDFFGWGAGIPMFGEPDENGFVRDRFGMKYSTTSASMGAYMPAPGEVLFDDITKWRDYVKLPDISHVDWNAVAADALKGKDIVHNPVIVFNEGYFMTLMNMMGFMGGLCAMQEEPEEVYALFDYLSAFYLEREKHLIKEFHADVYHLSDDTAAMACPFIDVDTYRNLVKPFHKREADLALDAGLMLMMHDCGKSESFIDDWIDLGVTSWDPAQVSNDLVGIKNKYQGKLTLIGAWDNQGPISYPNTADEELRDALVDYIDTFAPNGGFCYMPSVVGSMGEEHFDRKMKLIKDVYLDYGRDWYKNHG